MQAPGGPGSGTRTPASGYENPFEELTDEEKARILRRHLVSREQREHISKRRDCFFTYMYFSQPYYFRTAFFDLFMLLTYS